DSEAQAQAQGSDDGRERLGTLRGLAPLRSSRVTVHHEAPSVDLLAPEGPDLHRGVPGELAREAFHMDARASVDVGWILAGQHEDLHFGPPAAPARGPSARPFAMCRLTDTAPAPTCGLRCARTAVSGGSVARRPVRPLAEPLETEDRRRLLPGVEVD